MSGRRVICEVCLESVDVDDCLLESDEDGRPIVFCSSACADEFDADEAFDPIAADRGD